MAKAGLCKQQAFFGALEIDAAPFVGFHDGFVVGVWVVAEERQFETGLAVQGAMASASVAAVSRKDRGNVSGKIHRSSFPGSLGRQPAQDAVRPDTGRLKTRGPVGSEIRRPSLPASAISGFLIGELCLTRQVAQTAIGVTARQGDGLGFAEPERKKDLGSKKISWRPLVWRDSLANDGQRQNSASCKLKSDCRKIIRIGRVHSLRLVATVRCHRHQKTTIGAKCAPIVATSAQSNCKLTRGAATLYFLPSTSAVPMMAKLGTRADAASAEAFNVIRAMRPSSIISTS